MTIATTLDPARSLEAGPRFSSMERDRRWDIGRKIMDERGLGALIVFGSREGAFPAPFSMDTFFTNDRPGAIVVFPRDREPIALAFVPAVNGQARSRGEDRWIQPRNLYGGAPKGEALVKILQRLDLQKESIGVLGLDPHPPLYFDGPIPDNTWKTVLEGLPGATFEPVGRLFFELTASRSGEELAVIEWSASVGESICQTMRETTRPGVREADIYASIVEACPKSVGFTAEVFLRSGKKRFRWANVPRVIESGDVVIAEIFASFGTLETQHQPSIAVGRVHPDFERAACVARESYEAGLETLRAGRTFGEVVQAMCCPLEKTGGSNIHPLIHSINPYGLICGFGEGFSKVPGAEPYALIGDDVELSPGMAFSFQPSCMFDQRFVNLGGTVVVGEKEPLELNHISTRLMHV